jgi:hypothetical protein
VNPLATTVPSSAIAVKAPNGVRDGHGVVGHGVISSGSSGSGSEAPPAPAAAGGEGVPEVERSVGAPGAPELRAPGEAGGICGFPEPLHRPPQPEVAERDGVGVTADAHRDVGAGPGTEAGQAAQDRVEPVRIRSGEVQVTRRHGTAEGPDGRDPPAGQPEPVEVGSGEALGRGEEVGDAADREGERVTVARDQPGGQGAGGRDRDLLAEDGPDRGLERLGAARDPHPRQAGDQPAEQRVAAEAGGDGIRVRVEVEQAAAAADHSLQVGEVVQADAEEDVAVSGGQQDDRCAPGGAEGADVAGGGRGLDSGDGPNRRGTRAEGPPRTARGGQGGA